MKYYARHARTQNWRELEHDKDTYDDKNLLSWFVDNEYYVADIVLVLLQDGCGMYVKSKEKILENEVISKEDMMQIILSAERK